MTQLHKHDGTWGKKTKKNKDCRDADALKSSVLCSLSSRQLVRKVKIQVGDVVSGTMEYQLEVSSRASDLLAQFHLRSSENGKGKLRRCDAGLWRRAHIVICNEENKEIAHTSNARDVLLWLTLNHDDILMFSSRRVMRVFQQERLRCLP